MFGAPKIVAIGTLILFAGCVVDPPPPAPQSTAAPQSAIADGTYDLDAGSCGEKVSETRLTISDDQFRFYESSCRLQSDPRGTGGLARLICTGEGEQWVRQVSFESSPNLLTISEGTQAFRYHRCS